MKKYFKTETDAVNAVNWADPNIHSASFMTDDHICNCNKSCPGFYIYDIRDRMINEFIVCKECFNK